MKKLLSVLLVLAMVASLFVIVPTADTAATEIATEEDLLKFIEDVNEDGEGDMYYVLTADITLTQVWEEVEWFAGVLDGNGHKITLTQPMADSMFDMLDLTAIIKNLTIDGINLSGNKEIYGFCNENNGQIWDVNFTNVTLVSESTDVGLINKNQEDGVISRVTATVNITGKGDRAAGLAVRNYGVIRYCTMYGTIKSNYHVGGFSSDAKAATFEGCINYATIIATCSRAAGISATNRDNTTFKNCINYGTLLAWRVNDASKKTDTKLSGMGTWNNKNDGGVVAENCLNVGLLVGNEGSTCIGAMSAETNVGSSNPGTAVTTFTNCYTLAGVINKFTNTNHTDANFDYTQYTAYADIGVDATQPAFNGTEVTAEELKSAEMIAKLGSAFQLNTGADKDQYPIILVADTTVAPSPVIENDNQGGNDDQGGQQGGTTNPPAGGDDKDDETEPVTEAPTTPATNAPADEDEGGCASVVGGASVALLAIAATVPALIRKKKED